jgi:hypothetical protein
MIIATWNVEDLYRPGAEFGPTDDAAYEAKLAALAGAVRSIRPDVLAVQEVGTPEALQDLAHRVQGAWHLAISEEPNSRGIRVAFLSRPALPGRGGDSRLSAGPRGRAGR